MIKVGDLFDVHYGSNLELNSLKRDSEGINFVSRTARNNGVSGRVALQPRLNPLPAGTITVAGGGSVMESFLQTQPYYSGRDLYYLVSKTSLNDSEKLYYCSCLRANKYRYNYGRQANRTLRDILIPSPEDLPTWVNEFNPYMLDGKDAVASVDKLTLGTVNWQPFNLATLFELKKGRRLTKAQMLSGNTPFIGSTDGNNGITAFVGQTAQHPGNVITVNYNGSVAEAFYQPLPFRASDDVNVLYPLFKLTPAIATFITTLIRLEKYRFNYGRKWHLERMAQSEIYLPVTLNGNPDWEWMTAYIQTLPFSSQL